MKSSELFSKKALVVALVFSIFVLFYSNFLASDASLPDKSPAGRYQGFDDSTTTLSESWSSTSTTDTSMVQYSQETNENPTDWTLIESLECEDAAAPVCSGGCPEGEHCELNDERTGCGCKPTPDCGDAEAPTCTGKCSGMESCVTSDDGMKCECIEWYQDCGDVESGFCAQGSCPDGEICRINEVSGECGCIEDTFRECSGNPCGLYCENGVCPPGETCAYNDEINMCGCTTQDVSGECGDLKEGFCFNGVCPEGMFCSSISSAGTCGCKPMLKVKCGSVSVGDTGIFSCSLGDCPDGENCQYNDVEDKCGCTDDSLIHFCQQKKYPYCSGGICRVGTCTSSEENKNCYCKTDDPGCDTYNPKSCSEGTCDEGERCVLTDAGYCDCTKIQSTRCEDQDWFYCIYGECPDGLWCQGRIVDGSALCECVEAPECSMLEAPLCNGGLCPEGTECRIDDWGGCSCLPIEQPTDSSIPMYTSSTQLLL